MWLLKSHIKPSSRQWIWGINEPVEINAASSNVFEVLYLASAEQARVQSMQRCTSNAQLECGVCKRHRKLSQFKSRLTSCWLFFYLRTQFQFRNIKGQVRNMHFPLIYSSFKHSLMMIMLISNSQKREPVYWHWNYISQCKDRVWVRKPLRMEPPLSHYTDLAEWQFWKWRVLWQ